MELARLTPRSRAKRDKEEKFKKKVAEFSQMMADKAEEREIKDQFEQNKEVLKQDDKLKI